MLNYDVENTLAAISTSVFCEGMEIHTGIYYKNQNDYVLICRDVTVTPELVQKLKHFAYLRQSIYIEKAEFKNVLAENFRICQLQSAHNSLDKSLDEVFTKEQLEQAIQVEANYQVTLSDTESMLDQLADTDTLPMELTNQIVSTMSERLLECDNASLLRCVNSIRESDQYLYSHCVDVGILNGLIARWMKMPPAEIATAIKIGYLHDIGKVKIPSEILNKPASLTEQEFAIVKKHPVASYEILLNSGETDEKIIQCVRAHHEHVNGTGYPDKLTFDQIPLLARVTSVSDVYSAMVSKRVYKPQNSPFDILEEFAKNSFADLDYTIISLFLEYMPQELVGKSVILSNGEIAKVVYVSPRDFSHPIVKTASGVFQTTKELRCVSMRNPISLFLDQPITDIGIGAALI